jgi:hypothetical protein
MIINNLGFGGNQTDRCHDLVLLHAVSWQDNRLKWSWCKRR